MGINHLVLGMKAKKSLGQNFLIDKNVIHNIAREISASFADLIIEIGPGRGALTKVLKDNNSYYIAYELDNDMHEHLDSLENEKLKVIYKDFLSTNIKEDIKNISYKDLYIVGNLPYYITTPIIEHIITENLDFKKFTLMVQKEVADRFMAKVHTKEYGYFTVLLDYYFNITKVCNVSKNAFNPVPKVDSTVLTLTKKEEMNNIDTANYFNFLKQCFKEKRKTLHNNLKDYNWNTIKNILNKYNLNEMVRAEELSQEIFLEIFKSLNEQK